MHTLALEDLRVDLGGKSILHGLTLTFASGGLTGLVGPNGAGKSTLLRALARLVPPSGGRIRLNGTDIAAVGRRDLARQIAYLPQGHILHWPLSAEHVVSLGRLPHAGRLGVAAKADGRAVEMAMARTDTLPLAGRAVTMLSGGERSRVMLARALAVESPVLLADEPVASLDPYHQLHAMTLLRDLAREERLVIAVLHDLPLAARFCDRLVLLHDGNAVAAGTPAQVLARENLVRAYGIEAIYGQQDGEQFVLAWRHAPPRPETAGWTE